MNTLERFEIVPLVGTTSVQFGMVPDEVAVRLGSPDQTTKNYLRQRVEFRSFMNIAYSLDAFPRLCNIGFGRQMENVIFKEVNLFQSPSTQVIEHLATFDESPLEYLGFVVFLELGLALTGFHDQDESQKAVSLFEKGAWDRKRDRMKEFIPRR